MLDRFLPVAFLLITLSPELPEPPEPPGPVPVPEPGPVPVPVPGQPSQRAFALPLSCSQRLQTIMSRRKAGKE
jgi:hypothetical protein